MEKTSLLLANKIKKLFLIILTFFFINSFYSFSQDDFLPCGTTKMVKNEFEKNPEIYLKNKAILDSLSIIYENEDRMNIQRTIPVVFHILHEGGPIGVAENISKEQVEDAVRLMNEDFNAENEDLSNVISEFQNIIGDIQLTFVLAKIDPNGNCRGYN